MKQPAVLFLEPVNHILKVVESAHRKGVTPIAIHQMPLQTDAPYGHASKFIAATEQIDSWMDSEKLWMAYDKLTEQYNVVGTYAAAEITLEFESLVRERLGLPHNPASTVAAVLDKQTARQVLASQGLTKLRFYSQKQIEQWSGWPENFSAFFKPVNGAGSAHVYHCSNEQELEKAIDNFNAENLSSFPILRDYLQKHGRYFLEEEAKGELLSLECITFDGEVTPLGVTSRTVLANNPEIEMGASFPYPHSNWKGIVDKVTAIHHALGIRHGATHTEIIVDQEGNIELVELNPRFIGADMLLVVNAALQSRFEDKLLELGLGRKPELSCLDNHRFAALQYVLPSKDLASFNSIYFPPEEVVFSRVSQPIGKPVVAQANQFGYLGGFIATGNNYDSLTRQVAETRSRIKVNGELLGNHPSNQVTIY